MGLQIKVPDISSALMTSFVTTTNATQAPITQHDGCHSEEHEGVPLEEVPDALSRDGAHPLLSSGRLLLHGLLEALHTALRDPALACVFVQEKAVGVGLTLAHNQIQHLVQQTRLMRD